MELYRRLILNSKGNQQVIKTRTTAPLSSPGSYPDLMTETELILLLIISEIGKSQQQADKFEK
jgi:hypothetical protein